MNGVYLDAILIHKDEDVIKVRTRCLPQPPPDLEGEMDVSRQYVLTVRKALSSVPNVPNVHVST